RIIVAMNSSCGTIKHVINELRKKGEKVGLLKIRVFRPFMPEIIVRHLESSKAVAVLDRAASFGAYGGPLFSEIRSAFHENKKKPHIINYIYGLGGRDLTTKLVEQVYNELKDVASGNIGPETRTLGVRE
ncbi:MAG: pyruvate ferredoxin oxidoreductase, partial [Candidatus Woesearchaeota archaeon]